MGNRNSAETSNNCYISQLPNEVLVKIFSYLNLEDFSRCAQVCKQWQPLIYDENYWWYRLLTSQKVWKYTNFVENKLPEAITKTQVEEIYDPNNLQRSRMIYWMRQKGFCPKRPNETKPLRLLFFGLGIANNKITRIILSGRNSSFEAFSLIPGNNNGIGGGVAIKYKARHIMHVITLYTNIKAIREHPDDPVKKDLFSKWLVNNDSSTSTLLPSIKQVIQSVDGFVFASINSGAKQDSTWLHNSAQCLNLIMEEAALTENSQFRRPLLHLSCSTPMSSDSDSEMMCNIDYDQMKRFPRPWNICKMNIENIKAMDHGFNWLMYAALK